MATSIDRLRRFAAMPRNDRAVAVAALILVPAIWVALRLLGYKATRRILSRRIEACEHPECGSVARQTANLVNAASRAWGLPRCCLARSLTLQRLLASRGVPTDVRIGVSLDGGQLVAHAWVEHLGKVINDSITVVNSYAALETDLGHSGLP